MRQLFIEEPHTLITDHRNVWPMHERLQAVRRVAHRCINSSYLREPT